MGKSKINKFLSNKFDTDLNEIGNLGKDLGMGMLDSTLGTATGVLTGQSFSDLVNYKNKTDLGNKLEMFTDTQAQVGKALGPLVAGAIGSAFGVPPGVTSAAFSGIQQLASPLADPSEIDPRAAKIGNIANTAAGIAGPLAGKILKNGGSIHIDPKNKGKFNATKARTGKTTEELTHSKNPLTRKRAIFAQNAAKWKYEDGDVLPNYLGDYEEYEGPSHINGGIPVMVDRNGNTHEVEGGEVSHTLSNGEKYIYSKDFGTAQKMKRAQAKYTGKRPNDKYSKEVEQQKADKLADLNETMKQKQQSKDLMKLNKAYGKYMMKYGGKIKYNDGNKLKGPEDKTDYSSIQQFSNITEPMNTISANEMFNLERASPYSQLITQLMSTAPKLTASTNTPSLEDTKKFISSRTPETDNTIDPSMTDYQKWNVGLGVAGAALPAAYNLAMGMKKPELLNASDFQTNQDFGFNNLQWEDIDASPMLRDVEQTEAASRYMASQMGLDPTAAANMGRTGKIDAAYKKGAIKSDISNKNKMGRLDVAGKNLAALQNQQAREYAQKAANAQMALGVDDINAKRKGQQQAFTSKGVGQLGAGLQQTAGTIGKIGQEKDILGMLPEIYNNPQFQKFFQGYLAGGNA